MVVSEVIKQIQIYSIEGKIPKPDPIILFGVSAISATHNIIQGAP